TSRLRTTSRFFFSSRRRHTRFSRDWSSDVCSSDLLFDSPNEMLALRPLDPVPPPPLRLVFGRLCIAALAAEAPAIEPAGVRRAARRRRAASGARRLNGHARLARFSPSAPVQLGVQRLLAATELARGVDERHGPRV